MLPWRTQTHHVFSKRHADAVLLDSHPSLQLSALSFNHGMQRNLPDSSVALECSLNSTNARRSVRVSPSSQQKRTKWSLFSHSGTRLLHILFRLPFTLLSYLFHVSFWSFQKSDVWGLIWSGSEAIKLFIDSTQTRVCYNQVRLSCF